MSRSSFIRRHIISLGIFSCSFVLFLTTLIGFSIILNRSSYQTRHTSALNGDIAWPVFDGGVDDPGSNTSESTISTSNAGSIAKLWQASLPITADGGVVEQPNVSTNSGVIDLVFINTVKGNLLAFNAATGAKIWEADPSSTNYNGQGTKSTPAIDPSGNYVYAYALDGFIHKYAIGTGAEVTGNGFPAQATLLPNNTEKGSASLNIANGYLYMTLSGNDGDYGHYVGHVVAVNLSSGTETVWNAECSNITQLLYTSGPNFCSNTMAGIWARPGVKVDPVTGNIFVATGNGNYNGNSGGHNWGDSIVELKPDLSQIVDSYTPTTYSSLDSSDADLGSTAPVILPKQASSNTPYLLVQAGKDHIIRLLNRSNLSGQSGPGHTGGELQTITISDEVHEQPAVWTDNNGTTWVFVTDESGDLYAYRVTTTSGTTALSQAYKDAAIGVTSSPFVANGVLYLDGNHLLALNASTGATIFTSNSLGVSLNQHWESPTVVNGTIFTSDNNSNLLAFNVPGTSPSPSPSPTPPSSSPVITTSPMAVAAGPLNTVLSLGKLTQSDNTNEVLWSKSSDTLDSWWRSGTGVSTGSVINISQNDIVSSANELVGNQHIVYTATTHNVWQTSWYPGQKPASKPLLVGIGNIMSITKTFGPDGTTNELYILTDSGVSEYWWPSGSNTVRGGDLFNLRNPIAMAKALEPDGSQVLYLADTSYVYMLHWGGGISGIQVSQQEHVSGITCLAFSEDSDGKHRLYVGTGSGNLFEFNWYTGGTIGSWYMTGGAPIVALQKWQSDTTQVLYMATSGGVFEHWWSATNNNLHTDTIAAGLGNINAITRNTDPNGIQAVYIGAGTNIYEAWWLPGGNGIHVGKVE